MRSEVRDIAKQLDAAYENFQKALALGEQVRDAESAEDVERYTDERWRVSVLSEQNMAKIKDALSRLDVDPTTTPAEKAFLQEKRKRLKDLAPLFTAQDRELRRNLGKRIEALRLESAKFRRNTQVIKQYIGAPGSKPWIR